MTQWILAKGLNGDQVYWTGDTNYRGQPRWSPWRHEAVRFSSATSALECTRTHRELDDSEEWRIVKVTPGCERLGVER